MICSITIPRLAAKVIDADRLKFRARAAGMENANAEVSEYRAKGGTRITCRVEIAELLATELEHAGAAARTTEEREACQRGLDEVRARIAHARAHADVRFYDGPQRMGG